MRILDTKQAVTQPKREDFGLSGRSSRKVVCIQGLGFVGAAMAAAVARAKDANGELCFDVVGVERDNDQGRDRAQALAAGRFPFGTPDPLLAEAIEAGHSAGNLVATTDPGAYEIADIVVVDVHLDVSEGSSGPGVDLSGFEAAVETLGQRLRPGSLVVVETTVPPGTCENVVRPLLEKASFERGLPADAILLAHSYERVMPGPDYLDSVINYWRVYAGASDAAAHACEAFLRRVINVAEYPLRRLHSMTASETAKVLENSYRAMNIAFIEEWGRFAEVAGIDLFEIIEAIRDRPTHSNIRQPGFGVGGYCLTKDPLFPVAASRMFLEDHNLEFPFCLQSLAVNRRMPVVNLDRLEHLVEGGIGGRSLILLGVAYRSEVEDTRHAPAEILYREAANRGARIVCHDPFVRYWQEMDLVIDEKYPDPSAADIVIFAVPHKAYRELDVLAWLGDARPFIYDCDNVLSDEMRSRLRERGHRVESTGRGAGL